MQQVKYVNFCSAECKKCGSVSTELLISAVGAFCLLQQLPQCTPLGGGLGCSTKRGLGGFAQGHLASCHGIGRRMRASCATS